MALIYPVVIEFDKSIVKYPSIKRVPGGASNDLRPNLQRPGQPGAVDGYEEPATGQRRAAASPADGWRAVLQSRSPRCFLRNEMSALGHFCEVAANTEHLRSSGIDWKAACPNDAFVELPGGISPPGAPRTVREPLDSHGSRCSAVAMT